MDRTSINSTMIASIAFDSSSSTLEIEFNKGGAIWQYYNFPEYLWNEFQYAESHGKFFNANIKDKFQGAKVG